MAMYLTIGSQLQRIRLISLYHEAGSLPSVIVHLISVAWSVDNVESQAYTILLNHYRIYLALPHHAIFFECTMRD